MSRSRCEEQGQTTVLLGLFLGVLLLGLGLAVDVGQLLSARRAEQVAADAGAWAGAVQIYKGGSLAQTVAEATADARTNGFATGAPVGTTVTVNSPPTSGAFNGNASYVEVVITQQVPTTFFRAVRALTTVSARAVAGSLGTGGTTDGVVVLDATNVSSALSLSSTASALALIGGGLYVNSSSATSVGISGASAETATLNRLRNTAAAGILLKMVPVPLTGQGVQADPFAAVVRPITSGMAVFAAQDINGVNAVLAPGRYDGGIRVRNGGTATLQPGVYVLRGGGSNYGLTTTGASSVVRQGGAGGVLIFNASSTYPAAGSTCGPISMAATGSVDLAAQTSGIYAGLLLWQDSACVGNQALTTTLGWTAFTGTVYLPGAGSRLTITQTANLPLTTQLVVNRLTVSGNFALTLTYDPLKMFGSRYPALVQ